MASAVIAAVFSDFPLLLADPIATSGCPLGGGANRICAAVGFPREVMASFDDCRVPVPGGSLALTGSVLLSAQTGSCPNTLLGEVTQSVDLTLAYRGEDGTVRRAVVADLSAAIAEHRGLNSPCLYTGVSAVVSGTIRALFAGGVGLQIELQDLRLAADVSSFTSECVPVDDRRILDGTVSVVESPRPRVFPLSFRDYALARVHAAPGVQMEMMGEAGGECFGGGSTVATTEAIVLPVGDLCPASGTVILLEGGLATRQFFYSGGALEVDTDGDGVADEDYPTCRSGPACS